MSASAFQSLLLHALSSHLHALAVALRAPRRDFSLASHGPSQGPQHNARIFPVLHCSCSNGCAIDSGADGCDPQAEVLGSIRGAEAAGESPMSKLMSLGVVQSRCASRGAVLASICANVIQTVFARRPLQLQALLKASNHW